MTKHRSPGRRGRRVVLLVAERESALADDVFDDGGREGVRGVDGELLALRGGEDHVEVEVDGAEVVHVFVVGGLVGRELTGDRRWRRVVRPLEPAGSLGERRPGASGLEFSVGASSTIRWPIASQKSPSVGFVVVPLTGRASSAVPEGGSRCRRRRRTRPQRDRQGDGVPLRRHVGIARELRPRSRTMPNSRPSPVTTKATRTASMPTVHASTPRRAATRTAAMMTGPASTSFHHPRVETVPPIGAARRHRFQQSLRRRPRSSTRRRPRRRCCRPPRRTAGRRRRVRCTAMGRGGSRVGSCGPPGAERGS